MVREIRLVNMSAYLSRYAALLIYKAQGFRVLHAGEVIAGHVQFERRIEL